MNTDIRSQTLTGFLACVLAIFILHPSTFILAQGPLTPPGAPTPTMKALDEIEPRINVQRTINPLPNDASYHYIISTPGSYYLSANLAVTKSHGIHITVSGVTLDLRGFEISRVTGTSGDGITIEAGAQRCTVKNGLIRGFANGLNTVFVSVDGGIRGCSLRELAVSGCSSAGIRVNGNATVESCRAHFNTAAGFVVSSGLLTNCESRNNDTYGFTGSNMTLINCIAADNGIDGITSGGIAGTGRSMYINCLSVSNDGEGIRCYTSALVSHCVARENGEIGITVGAGSVVESCTSDTNTGDGIVTGAGSTLTNCSAKDNSGTYGIWAGVGSTLTSCSAYSNSVEFGIRAEDRSTLTSCTAALNTSAAADSWGISAGAQCTISQCSASGNLNTNGTPTGSTGGGITVANGSTVQTCTVAGNKGDGIRIFNDSRVAGNTCDSNGFPVGTGDGAGIHSSSSDNRIEGNNVTDNTRGIDVDSSGNVIIKNTASGNATNYVIAADNVFGAIVDRSAPASAAVSGSSAPSSGGTTDPWANFSY